MLIRHRAKFKEGLDKLVELHLLYQEERDHYGIADELREDIADIYMKLDKGEKSLMQHMSEDLYGASFVDDTWLIRKRHAMDFLKEKYAELKDIGV